MLSFTKLIPRNGILNESRLHNTSIAVLLAFESTELDVIVLTYVIGPWV